MIHGEFGSCTAVSRARRCKLRHRCDGICIYCASPVPTKFHCSSYAAIRFQFLRTTTRLAFDRVGAIECVKW